MLNREERLILAEKTLKHYKKTVSEWLDCDEALYGICFSLHVIGRGIYGDGFDGYDDKFLIFPELKEIALKYDAEMEDDYWWRVTNTEVRIKVLEELIEIYKKDTE